MSDSGLVCEKLPTSDDASGTSSEQINSSPDEITNNDLPRPRANTIPSAVVLPMMKQSEYEHDNKEEQQISKIKYCDEENFTKISVNEIKNNREDYSSFANKLENINRPNSTESKNTFMQTQVRPSESHQKKENTNENRELPNQVLKNKDNSIFSKNQTSSSISDKNIAEKTFVQNTKNQNSFMKYSTLDDEINRNKNEAFPNANIQNTPKIKQLESSQKSPNSTENRTKPDNIKPMVKATEVCSQNNLSKTDSLDHSCLPLALVSGHYIKDRQKVNICSPAEDQSQSLDQSNGKSLPKNNQTVKCNEESRIDPLDKNFQILGKNDGINSERSRRHLEMASFHSNDDQMKSPFLRPSCKVPIVTRTPSKQNNLEENLISSQFVTEPNRNKECYIQRQMKGPNPSFTSPPICPYNSEPDIPPNKYPNDYISTNNSTNQYNNNQTYINTNQEPLNLIDTNSKFLSNAISIPNVQRTPLPNQPQQFSLSNPRLQSMPNVNKDTFKSEYVPSSFPDSGMNSLLLHNQSFYAQCSAPSLNYNTMYPHNSALRRSAVGNQPVTPNNNAVLPVQQPGYYSSQSVQRSANIPGSSSVMWTQNRDQKISTDISSFSENYGNLGIGSSFDKLPKTLFSNSSRNNHYSSTHVSVKDLKLQQNVETRTKPNVDWNRGHSPFPQPFPGCYNQMKQKNVPQNLNNFPYRNEYSLQSAPNYFKRGPSSGNAADLQNLNQNQNLAMQFQRSYQETNHYDPSFQMQSYGSLRDMLHVPPNPICTPPLLRAQGVASFNLQNKYDQPGPKSINSTVNPPKLGNPNVVNTYVTTINSAPIFWSAKDFQQNKDSSTKELSPLLADQLSAYQYSQNKNLEFNRYQTNTTNISKTKPIISSLEPTTMHPIYNKDSGNSSTNTAQMVCSSNNSGSILTWSQAHPLTFDPNRSLHVTHDDYANYNPQTVERKPAQKYIPQQETLKSYQNSPQTLNNNYFKTVVSSFDSLQGSQIQQNISSSSSNSNNYISTYNSNASAQNLESQQVENQSSTIIKKLPANSETGISPSNGQNTRKAQVQDKSNECFIPSETRITKLSTSSQLENGYFGKDLDQRALEGKSDEQCFPKAPPTAMSEDSSFKTSDVLRNLAMTSDESFLFSDLDPLFTSSLLTNDLAYFPETNSAFDQCFEDAASIIMNTVNLNEAETVENVNNMNRIEHSKNAPQLQPQPTIFPNTSDNNNNNNINNDYNNDNNYNNINDNDNNNTIPKSVPMPSFLQKQSNQINTTSGIDPNQLPNSHSPIGEQSQCMLFVGSNESIQTEVTSLNISSSSSVIGQCVKTVYSGVNPKDSPESTFSGMWASKMAASELIKRIADPIRGNEWNPQKEQVQGKKQSGMGIKKKNQEKKSQPTSGEKSSKSISKKTTVIRGAPRPRGRPPKNRPLVNPNLIPSETLSPGISISGTNTGNEKNPLDIHSKTSGDNHLNEIPKQNSQVNLPEYSNVSLSSRENKCTKLESLTTKAKSTNKNLSTKSFLAPKENKTKLVSNRQTQCEMSELELIDLLTKRFDSISNIEEKESSGKIKNHSSSPIPESLDRSKDSSIKDSTCKPGAVSVEERAVSREKTLIKAYLKLKKKLDKRIKLSLRRQRYLRRNELKINKGLWKLSKAELKTESPDSSADFKAEHLSRSYFNRSPLSADDNKLIVTADSTGIDADLNKRHGSEKAETFEIETVVNRKELQDESTNTNDHFKTPTKVTETKDGVSRTETSLLSTLPIKKMKTNDIFETSTKVTETKDGVSRRETSLLSTLPIKDMKTCLKEGLDPIQQDSLLDQESKDKAKSPDLIKGDTTECSESVGESQNINAEINSKELSQVENSSKEDNRSNQETDNLPSVSQTKVKPPITKTCSLKTPPSTSPPRSVHKTLPEPILQFRVETEEVTPRKVGPTIVENAKICFQSINCYLENDGSNFDSFLMSYANIVHGLLNCGAERYNRIKAVLLNTPKERSDNCNIENKGKSIILSNSNVQGVGCKDSLIPQRDIDASDVEGDFEKGENTIDMDDFSCSYADIVKEILSSRGDEYCNIKKAINRNICWNMVDAYEEPINSFENRSSPQEEEKSAISALPVLSNSDETFNELLNEKSLQLKNLDPDSVIIKRKKRKSPKKKGYIRGKTGITEMGISGTSIRKRKPKKEKNSSIQMELWKGNESISETKTSVSKTTIDNSHFVAQNTKPSNSKTKYSSLFTEPYPEDYDSKCPLSSDENFVEESTGDYVIGLGSESGSDERSTTTSYIKPVNPVINPSSKEQAGNFSDLKLNLESDKDFQGDDEKTRTLDSGFGNIFSITTPDQNFKEKLPKASRKPTATNIDYVKCPCGCSDDEEDTRDDSIDNKLRDLTTSFKTRNRSKIIKPKSASVSKKCGQLRKLNKYQEKINPKILNHVHRSEKNVLVNDDPGNFFKYSKMNSDQKMFKNLENKFPKCSTNDFSVINKKIESFTALQDLDHKLKQNSAREDLCDFGEETGGRSKFSDNCWKPEKTLKNTKQKLLQTKKNKTRRILSNYSLFSKNNTKVGYLDKDNFHRELSTVKKDKEENVLTGETKPTKKTAIKELNHDNNSLKISSSPKDFTSKIQLSFTSENKYTKKDKETENLKLPSFETIYNPNNNITVSNNVDKNNTSQILLEDYYDTPNAKQKLIFSDDNISSSAEVDVDEASEVDEGVRYPAGNSKSRSKAKDETNSMSTLNAHSFDTTRKENIEDDFDNVEKGPHSCEKRLRSLIENITEISRATKRMGKEHPASVRNSTENPADASKIDLIPPEDKTRNPEETKVKTEIMETIDETIHCPIALAKYEDSSSDGCQSSDEGNKKLISFDKCLDQIYEVKLPSPLNKPKKKYKPTLKIKSIGIDNKIIIRKSYHKNTKKHGQDLTREDKNIFNIIGENITKVDKAKKTYIQQDSNKESLTLASHSISGKNKKFVSSSGSHKFKTDRYSDEQIKPVQTISKTSVPKSESQISNTNLDHSKVFPQKRELSSPDTPENLKFPASSEYLKAKKEKRFEEPRNCSNVGEDSTVALLDIQTDVNVAFDKKATRDSKHTKSSPCLKVTAPSSCSTKKAKKQDIFEKPSNYSPVREDSTVALLNIQTDVNVAFDKKATHDSKHIKDSPCLKVTAPSSCSTKKAKKQDIFEKPSDYSPVREDSTVALLNIQTGVNVAFDKKATHDSKHIKGSPCLKVKAPSSCSKDKKRKKTTEDENIGNSLAGIKDGIKERLIVDGDPIRSKTSTLSESPSEQIQEEHLKPGGSLHKDNDNEIARKPKRIRRSGKDRPNLQCTFCLKFFKSASELLFHTRYHTGDRPFVCDQCSKAFVSKSHLTRHQRTHSTERRYVCPICDRAFATHYSMLIHELIHSGLKPHACGDCSKAFRTKGYLSRHRKKYHQVESSNP